MSTSRSVDEANAAFWDELCGSNFAIELGITDRTPESLARFDRAYLDYYPYLLGHVPVASMRGQRILEIGLGYGTLSQKITEAGAEYHGLDIAAGPVSMVNHRLRMAGLPGEARQGNMLKCPHPDGSLDGVVSIGCFHHTGDLQRCLDETWRVLKPGGRAFIMVYNRFSLRQWTLWPGPTLRAALGFSAPVLDAQRKLYDPDTAGGGAPETVFTGARELRTMMRRFSQVQVRRENCDDLRWRGKHYVDRRRLLPLVGPVLGLDLYASAVK